MARRNQPLPSRKVRPISRNSVFNPNKGLNNLGSPNLIDDREWADLQNVEFDEGGVLRKRMGYTAWGDALTASRGLGQLVTATVNQVLTVDGTKLKYGTGSSWTEVNSPTFTANKETTFTQARAATYIWNGTDGGAKWDGTTLTRPGTMPRAQFSIFYSSYHISSGVDTQSSRVYIARLTDASIFTNASTTLNNATEVPGATVFAGSGANFIDIQPDDGDKITGMGVFQDQLIIFKQFSTYQLTLDDSGDPSVFPVTRAAGCVAPRTIVSVENDLYFLSREGVRVLGNEPNYFSAIRTNILSKRIEPITDSIDETKYALCNAIYHKNQYILNIPTTSGELDTTIVYNKEFQSWTAWKNTDADAMARFINSDNTLSLLYLNKAGTQVYRYTPDIYNDNGSPINSYALSKVFDFRNPDITKYFVDLGLMFRSLNGALTVTVYTEGNKVLGVSENQLAELASGGMGDSILGINMLGLVGEVDTSSVGIADQIRRIVLNTNSTTIRFKIENNRTNENFVLLGFIHAFYPYTHFTFDSVKKIYL